MESYNSNFPVVIVTRKIDGTLETEHSRQSSFKTASDKESKCLTKKKSNWNTKYSTSNWHIAHICDTRSGWSTKEDIV